MAEPLTITRPDFVKGVRRFQFSGALSSVGWAPNDEQRNGWAVAAADHAMHGDFYHINRCIDQGDDWDTVVASGAYNADYPGAIAREAKMTKRYAWKGEDGNDRELVISMQPMDWDRERRADDAARKFGWPGVTV